MKDRIRYLRKELLKLTQQQFGDMINVKRSTIASYEIGQSTPIDAVIMLICKQWNVSKEWLLTGEGEVFIEVCEYETAKMQFEEMMKDAPQSKKAALALLMELMYTIPDDAWNRLIKKMNSIIESADSEQEPPELTIEEKVEAYRKELLLEQEAREKSGA